MDDVTRKRHGTVSHDYHFAIIEAKDARIRELETALRAAKWLFDEALPKFNWGASALDANAIRLLNEVPPLVDAALALPSSADREGEP